MSDADRRLDRAIEEAGERHEAQRAEQLERAAFAQQQDSAREAQARKGRQLGLAFVRRARSLDLQPDTANLWAVHRGRWGRQDGDHYHFFVDEQGCLYSQHAAVGYQEIRPVPAPEDWEIDLIAKSMGDVLLRQDQRLRTLDEPTLDDDWQPEGPGPALLHEQLDETVEVRTSSRAPLFTPIVAT